MPFSHGGRDRSFRPSRPQNQHSSNRNAGRSRFSNSQRSLRAPRFAGSHISKDKYVNQAQAPQEEAAYTPVNTFDSFGLDEVLVANIKRHGYTSPTPIQDQAIPALMSGRDVVGLAQTGTGKTAAFLLPLIHKILNDRDQGVMIVAPTRELALQINDEFRAFAQGLRVSVCTAIGGASLSIQMQNLRENPHFIIGTPGRLKDLIDRGAINTNMFTNIVLDEVDRMLDIGFRRDIQYLIDKLPQERHAAFFSATINGDAQQIMHSLLTDPVRISVKSNQTSNHIHQDIIKVMPGQNKVDVLHELLTQAEFERVIIFGRTKHGINKLERMLSDRGLRVRAIHGNKSQAARQRSLQDFKRGRVQALLATDIASRGIDVEDVTHVINYDEPQTYDDYIHRIGRTGRAGKAGKALTFVI